MSGTGYWCNPTNAQPYRIRLQEQDAMIAISDFDLLVEGVEKPPALGREERQEAQRALLEFPVGQQKACNFALMPLKHPRPEHLGPASFPAHTVELIQHFLRSVVESAQQSLIEFPEGLAQAFDDLLQLLLTCRKTPRQGLRQRFGFEFCAKPVASGKDVAHVEL